MSKECRGRFFEDFSPVTSIGAGSDARSPRPTTSGSTNLTMNTNQMHFNQEWAERSEFGERSVVSTFTLALVLGLGVRDTSENAAANLGWSDIKLPKPVFVGDTLWAESEVLDARESKSRPSCGIVSIRTRGINQRREVVIEFVRAFMVFRRDAPEVVDAFPTTDEDWTVGG